MSEIISCEFCGQPRPDTVSSCPYCKPSKQQLFGSRVNKAADNVTKTLEDRKARQSQEQAAGASAAQHLPPSEPEIEVTSKYAAMTAISVVIKGLAALMVLVGFIGLFVGPEESGRKIVVFLICIFASILTWAYSEFIDIGIDIESNQRKLIKILIDK